MGQVQMTNTGLVPVIGVERPHKGTGKPKADREGQTADWWMCVEIVCSGAGPVLDFWRPPTPIKST